jgi:hypothetical protein
MHDKMEYMFVCPKENAQQSNNLKIANKSFENVAKLKYLAVVQMQIACLKKLSAD